MCMECSEKVYKSLTAVVRAAERAEGACGEAFMHAKRTKFLIIHVVFIVNTRIKARVSMKALLIILYKCSLIESRQCRESKT